MSISKVAVFFGGLSLASGSVAFEFTPVPEPNSLSLLGIGAFAAILIARYISKK